MVSIGFRGEVFVSSIQCLEVDTWTVHHEPASPAPCEPLGSMFHVCFSTCLLPKLVKYSALSSILWAWISVCVHMYICITTIRCFLFLLWLLCCSVCIPWCSINIKLFLHSRPAVSPRAPHTLHPLPAFTTPLRTAAKHRAIRENSVAISSHIGIWMDLEL